MRIPVIIVLLLIFTIPIFAQTADSTYQKYLNDNTKVPPRIYYGSGPDNIVKTDFLSLLDGRLPVIWEHRFNYVCGFDASVGMIFPFSCYETHSENFFATSGIQFLGINPYFRSHGIGYSGHIEPKLFLRESTTHYWSTHYEFKKYPDLNINEVGVSYGWNFDDEEISFQPSISLVYGQQVQLKSGNQNYKYIGDMPAIYNESTLMKISYIRLIFRFQIGYMFNYKITPIE